jgi:hypothetical protein
MPAARKIYEIEKMPTASSRTAVKAVAGRATALGETLIIHSNAGLAFESITACQEYVANKKPTVRGRLFCFA